MRDGEGRTTNLSLTVGSELARTKVFGKTVFKFNIRVRADIERKDLVLIKLFDQKFLESVKTFFQKGFHEKLSHKLSKKINTQKEKK